VRQLAAAFRRRKLASGNVSSKLEAQKRQQAAALQRWAPSRNIFRVYKPSSSRRYFAGSSLWHPPASLSRDIKSDVFHEANIASR
jgi:hypothetical protein